MAHPGLENNLPENPFEQEGTPFSEEDESVAVPTVVWRAPPEDPLGELPQEVLVEIMRYLSCVDIFCWRVASLQVNRIKFPPQLYRRLFIEEMVFLPGLMKNMRDDERDRPGQRTNWEALFNHATRVWRRSLQLRNRRRIWKVVQPMAEEIVERSTQHLCRLGGLTDALSSAITVARGYVGVRSGIEGRHDTIVFSELFRPIYGLSRMHSTEPGAIEGSATGSSADPESSMNSEDAGFLLTGVDIWLHPMHHHVSGLRFYFAVEQNGSDTILPVEKTIGDRTAVCEHFEIDSSARTLTGFRVCWAAGHVRGVQLVLEDPRTAPTEYGEAEMMSKWFGSNDGPIRRLVAPRKFRTLAGVTAFVSSAGRIETFAILEKKKPLVGDGGRLYTFPDTVPLTHREASLWESPPPNDVDLMDRQGPPLEDWRLRPAQCEVFTPAAQHQPPGTLYAIVSFSDGQYLLGIRFLYKDPTGDRIHRDIGDCSCGTGVKVTMAANEEISLVLIGHGPHGIMSLQVRVSCLGEKFINNNRPSQLVTSSGKVGSPCGPRYHGIHTTYAVKGIISAEGREGPGRVVYIDTPIIGFHGLYCPKVSPPSLSMRTGAL